MLWATSTELGKARFALGGPVWRVHGVWGSQLIRTLKVAEAEAQVLPARHLPRDRARPEPTTACGRASDRVRQGLRP